MKPSLHCFIVTGMSGAGRSLALSAFEDLGVHSVDNLPLKLLPGLLDMHHEGGKDLKQIAVGVDIRQGPLLDDFTKSLQDLSRRGISYQVIFLEAGDDVLIRRFSETRRRHPLGKTAVQGIKEERKRMGAIRQISDQIIDTSATNPNDLKNRLAKVIKIKRPTSMAVTISSFGFKYGIPIDADMVLDVRFLPNPHYNPKLKSKTGLNAPVANFVLRNPITKKFLSSLKKTLALIAPEYIKEGKSYLSIAIGCTGGRHRSVAIAEELKDYLTKKKYPTRIVHRDISK